MANTSSVLASLPLLDALRNDPKTTWTREDGSNLDVILNDTPLAICHLNGLLPFTYGDKVAVQFQYEDAAAIALAAHHLNVGNGIIVPQVQGLDTRCNIRFTVEFADTEYTPSVAVDQVVNIASRLPGEERLPCAFIGAYRSAESIPTSILTGLWKYPQVSGVSTSADLDDMNQYPLFGRTIPSDHGNAVPIIQFMYEVLGITHLAVLNVNDAYGNSFVNGLRMAAETYAPGMQIHQQPVDDDIASIRSALAGIKQVQYRYIFAIIFTSEVHDAVLNEAYAIGIAGTGEHQWLFADSFDSIEGRMMEVNSPLHLAYRGVGMLEATGGVPGIGLTGYEKFLNAMAEVNNPDDLEYLFSLWPQYDDEIYQESVDSFTNFLTPLMAVPAPFLYEATIALGLAACTAVDENLNLDGTTHFNKMINSVFEGINTDVVFDPSTGSKDPTYTLYKVTNYFDRPASEDGMVRFEESFTHLYREGVWEELTPYVFNDGSTNIPPDIPPLNEEDDTVHVGVRASVLTLCGLVLVLGVGLMVWTQRNRKARVVLASQPFFLHIICMGAMIMACTIIPLSIDHGVATLQGCTIACISIPWLGTMGFSMTMSALYTKTHRINIILNNANRMQRIKVTIWDVAKPMIFLLSFNAVVLSVMSALAPPEYEMIIEREDSFGRPDQTRGQCNFKDSYPYIGSVCLVNLAALLLTIIQAVKARNLSLEFAESAQIFRALITITMVLFVGGPVLLLSRDNANTFLFVGSAILFVASTSILLLLFVPKIQIWMNSKKKTDNRRLYISGIEMSRPMTPSLGSARNDSSVDDFDDNDDEFNTEEFTGMKILTTKTREELLKENDALKRLLRHARMTREHEHETPSSNELDPLTTIQSEVRGGPPGLKSILKKKSSDLSQTRIDEERSEEIGRSADNTISVSAYERAEPSSSPRNIPDDDSATIESKERLESLREKREVAKMKFDTIVARELPVTEKTESHPTCSESATGPIETSTSTPIEPTETVTCLTTEIQDSIK